MGLTATVDYRGSPSEAKWTSESCQSRESLKMATVTSIRFTQKYILLSFFFFFRATFEKIGHVYNNLGISLLRLVRSPGLFGQFLYHSIHISLCATQRSALGITLSYPPISSRISMSCTRLAEMAHKVNTSSTPDLA